MDKSVKNKNFKFILIVSVLIVISVIVFTLITTKTNPFKNIVSTITGEEVKSTKNDNYNGFYTNKDLLDATYKIFSNCSIYSIDNIILIQDDDFTLYRSSCMGTYVKDRGKTKDLDINIEGNKYVVTYNKKKFQKDTTVKYLVENNNIADQISKTGVASLPLIVKETEFEGNYYDISTDLSDVDGNLNLSFKRDKEKNVYNLDIYVGKMTSVSFYSKSVKSWEELPMMYGIGKNLVIIETDNDQNKYSYSFKSYSDGKKVFDLSENLPIKIDGTELNYGSNSVYIKYNEKDKNFFLLIGNDKKFCVENSNSERAASYIFKLNYNYTTNKFDTPEYVKSIRGTDGCSEVESYIGG